MKKIDELKERLADTEAQLIGARAVLDVYRKRAEQAERALLARCTCGALL